jgi:hypothetical protein
VVQRMRRAYNGLDESASTTLFAREMTTQTFCQL